MNTTSGVSGRLMSVARLDFASGHRQPSVPRLLLASFASIVGSLLADAVIVVIGEALMPGTKDYVHFQFSDYGKLTVIGVVIACIAWPIVTRVCAAPRWLFFRLAILVTVILLLPDFYILYKGQPGDAVGVLMVMHLAIGAVTYNLLVRLAPARGAAELTPRPAAPARPTTSAPPPADASEASR
jgi:hypothetical protein